MKEDKEEIMIPKPDNASLLEHTGNQRGPAAERVAQVALLFQSADQPNIAGVITSYSIHYTKLYEGRRCTC